MKTAFEENLDSFLYGKTCTSDSHGYNREAKGTKANVGHNAKVRVGKLAAGVAVAGVFFFTPNPAAYASSPSKLLDGQRIATEAITSKMMRVDERGRRELVAKLIKLREEFKLSQDEIASMLNISKSTISKLERGEHFPDQTNFAKYETLLSLADYLRERLHGRKYAIRELLHFGSKTFADMTPIKFAEKIGEEGIDEVYAIFKRQYG
jgi:transcriptional regulator with XRE-family HTH domain